MYKMELGECAICFENISFGTETPCNHIFCTECLINWQLKEQEIPPHKCPICREKIPHVSSIINVMNIKSEKKIEIATDNYQSIPTDDDSEKSEDESNRNEKICTEKRCICFSFVLTSTIVGLFVYGLFEATLTS